LWYNTRIIQKSRKQSTWERGNSLQKPKNKHPPPQKKPPKHPNQKKKTPHQDWMVVYVLESGEKRKKREKTRRMPYKWANVVIKADGFESQTRE